MNQHNQRPCPACKNSNGKEIGIKNSFEMLVCLNCQTIYTANLPSPNESENYDEYYSELNLSVPEFVSKRIEEIVGDFSKFRQTNRLLDIGFGSGIILEVASKQNWDAFGTEVSKPAIDKAKQLGFEVFHGELTKAEYPDNYFDVIAASEILEHLHEPQDLLNEVARILRPGGLFWATTPFAKGLSYRLIGTEWSVISPPEHIQLFSKKGMYEMLSKSGFSQIELKTYGFNPMEVMNTYKSKFSQRRKANPKFNRVETSYQLNEGLTKSPARQKVKDALNGTLNIFRVGDSLKIFAKL